MSSKHVPAQHHIICQPTQVDLAQDTYLYPQLLLRTHLLLLPDLDVAIEALPSRPYGPTTGIGSGALAVIAQETVFSIDGSISTLPP